MESECNAERDSITKSKGIEMVTAERGVFVNLFYDHNFGEEKTLASIVFIF